MCTNGSALAVGVWVRVISFANKRVIYMSTGRKQRDISQTHPHVGITVREI